MPEYYPNWIKIDHGSIKTRKRKNIKGLQIEVSVSPYDVPEAIRGYKKDKSNRCIIQLRYLNDDEPKKSVVHDQNLSYVVGKNSRRLYSLEFDVDSSLLERWKPFEHKLKWAEMSKTIDSLAGDKDEPVNEENSELVKEAILHHRSELFEATACA
jgi:hypothetical protein